MSLTQTIPALQHLSNLPERDATVPRISTILGIPPRRRAGGPQGRAIETLGHAIEYLVDSRLARFEETTSPADAEAVQLLIHCSQEVFAVCLEIVPLRLQIRRWIAERLHRLAA